MFTLVTIKDKIRIEPDHFSKDYLIALKDEIHAKFSNKILPEVGLCISIHDILLIGDPYIYPGDGASHTETTFRLVVYRPFVGEILSGKIMACDVKNGIRVSMKFFDDVWIPPYLLPDHSYFQDDEKLWVWKYEEHDMFFDLNEEIRFKVNSVQFHTSEQDAKAPKVEPKKPGAAIAQQQQQQQQVTDAEKPYNMSEQPMIVFGRLNQPGLGLTSWWE